MDKTKKGTKGRQGKIDDDNSVGDVEERKQVKTESGKTKKERNARKQKDDSDEDDEVIETKPSKTNHKPPRKGASRKAENEDESDASDTGRKSKSTTAKNTVKGKGKGRDNESNESEDEKQAKQMKNKSENKEANKANQKKDKKGGVKSVPKKKADSGDDSNDDDDDDKPVVVAPRKGTQQNMSAFQMLSLEGDSSNDSDKDEERDSDALTEEKKPEIMNQKSKAKKPTKQERRKQKPTEDDIDKIVAEISNVSTSQKKKKKNAGGNAEAEASEFPDVHPTDSKPKPEISISSNMTQEELYKLMDEMALEDDEDDDGRKGKKKKKKGGKQEPEVVKKQESKEGEGSDEKEDEDNEGEASTVKTMAQKKKEKKERQKAEKMKKPEQTKGKEKKTEEPEKEERRVVNEKAAEAKETETDLAETKEGKEDAVPDRNKDPGEDAEDEGKTSKKDKKKKKGKEGEKDKDKEKTKKPSKMVQEILEQQRRLKEEEERLKREEEERIRKEEEAIRLKEEEERRIREKKEREKQKKKDKIDRLKKEGKYLTDKQKEDRKRLQMMLSTYQQKEAQEDVTAQTTSAEKKHPRYDKKPKKNRPGPADKTGSVETTPVDDSKLEPVLTEVEKPVLPESNDVKVEEPQGQEVKEEEEVKDAWDMSSAEEEEEEDEGEDEEVKEVPQDTKAKEDAAAAVAKMEKEKPEEPESEEEESTESESEEGTESSSEDDDEKTPQEKARDKAHARIQKRKTQADANRSLDKLRAPVVCVLGHVDTGKTKILDKLRRTNVQDGEAGGITQQIGATNVPQETIKEQTKMCKEFQKHELKLPGLLIIDTPGHESFSNLRSRGSSLCDIAILVVDIMHGLEPQTIESINLLKEKNTPFVVALNKIDRLYGWQTNPHSDVVNTLNRQKQNTRIEFNDRVQQVIVQFAEQGLNAALFYENKDWSEYYPLVPTSAHTGDGMGNLIALICEMTQKTLAERVMFSEELKATVMEVKTIHGLGTTIDVILVNGRIREGDHIVVAGQEGPIITQIRALLMPQPLRELRVKSQYEHHKEVVAAQGCKIVAKDLEKALAGLPLYVSHEPDEAEIYKEELSEMLKSVLGDVKVADKGVFVQASTLGSLEALLQFLKTSEIPFAGINIGPVHKRDVTKASVMLEHDQQYAVILAFDVKVEHDAQVMADSLGVRIFTADIIYHLFDAFTKYREDFKRQKREEFKNIAVFPCKLRILPQFIFNSRDPIVVGVVIEAGFLKEGTLLCVPSKEFVEVGRVSSIEVNHKAMERASKGQEVCIKIDPIPGEAPKMFGRHFDENDLLVSKISRQSIDAVKNYFREEMTKPDWQLIMELKKTFEIL